jgi:hypothetical protein
VGATRAKERLRIAEVKGRHYYLDRRVWRYMNGRGRKNCMQLEFGLAGDVDPLSPVDRIMVSDEDARALQESFAGARSDSIQRVYWRTDPSREYRRILRAEEDDRYIGLVGGGFVDDMWQLGRKGHSGLRPGDYQQHLYVVDYTTVARDNDSADLNQLTDTFSASGLWVAPLIKGWGGVCLRYGGRKR